MTQQEGALKRISELRRRFPRSAEQVLPDLEQVTVGATALKRFLRLPALAKAAINAGDLNKASAYAYESLDPSGLPRLVQRNGDNVYDGNMVLGLVALRGGDMVGAKQYLLKAGETTGSPALGSFGPNMTLAKALLDAGERPASGANLVLLDASEQLECVKRGRQECLPHWESISGRAAERPGELPSSAFLCFPWSS